MLVEELYRPLARCGVRRVPFARPARFELATLGSVAPTESGDSNGLDSVVTGSGQVTASEVARAFLGMVAKGETMPEELLEAFAEAVLGADPVGRLVLCVLDEGEAHKLARAIELAGVVLDGESIEAGEAAGSDGSRTV